MHMNIEIEVHTLITAGGWKQERTTQPDGVFTPYRYLGRFLKWSDGTTDYDSTSIIITVPETPTTFTCYLKDIQAGPEAMLPHGEFFDIHGEKKPMLIK
jgi:hypothetical protein